MSETDTKQTGSLSRVLLVFLKVSIALVGIAGMAVYAAPFLFVAELLNQFRAQISLVLVISGLILFQANAKIWGILQCLLGVAVGFPVLAAMLPADQPVAGSGPPITLMSVNVKRENKQTEPVTDLIAAHAPDVLLVIEYGDQWVDALAPVKATYSASILEPAIDGYGMAFFSRFPIVDSTVHKISNGDQQIPVIQAEIKFGNQSVVVVAVHLMSPRTAERMEIRNQQFEEVSKIIAGIRERSDQPIVVAGDFNCVPWSPHSQAMTSSNELRDSRVGFSYLGSWPTSNRLVRIPIDNVYVSDNIHIISRSVLDTHTSDHLAVMVEFSPSEPVAQ